MIAGIALIVIAAGIYYYNSIYKPELELEAGNSLFMAERYYGNDSLTKALNGDGVNLGVIDIADEFGEKVKAIRIIWNSPSTFGGIGNSGIGSYHGEAGFKSFSHFKSILEKSNLMELSLKYYPHSKRKLSWIQRFMGF